MRREKLKKKRLTSSPPVSAPAARSSAAHRCIVSRDFAQQWWSGVQPFLEMVGKIKTKIILTSLTFLLIINTHTQHAQLTHIQQNSVARLTSSIALTLAPAARSNLIIVGLLSITATWSAVLPGWANNKGIKAKKKKSEKWLFLYNLQAAIFIQREKSNQAQSGERLNIMRYSHSKEQRNLTVWLTWREAKKKRKRKRKLVNTNAPHWKAYQEVQWNLQAARCSKIVCFCMLGGKKSLLIQPTFCYFKTTKHLRAVAWNRYWAKNMFSVRNVKTETNHADFDSHPGWVLGVFRKKT